MNLIESNTATINHIAAILSGEERQHETCANPVCQIPINGVYLADNGKKFCDKICQNFYIAVLGVVGEAKKPQTLQSP